MNFPAADQERNDIRNAPPKRALAKRIVFRARNCQVASTTAAIEMSENPNDPVLELMIHSFINTHSLPSTKL